jgi:gliding motility-associated-like protein
MAQRIKREKAVTCNHLEPIGKILGKSRAEDTRKSSQPSNPLLYRVFCFFHLILRHQKKQLLFKIKSGLLLLIPIILTLQQAVAQICTGSLGDPVVNITFGNGNNPGPSLNAQLPNLGYVSHDCPDDGYYTITNQTQSCFSNSWHTVLSDHTPNDANGYMMLINASLTSGDFYVDTVKGLCSGTTYEFAAWVMNVLLATSCSNSGISPNLTFKIESETGAVLGTYNTGIIPQSGVSTWNQYGLFFKMPVAASNVVLRITNNAPGGCGNDLALDDITFRPCGPLVNANISGNGSNKVVCEGDPTIFQMDAVVSSGYSSPVYQWQLSTDDGLSWKDIAGATSTSYKRLPTGPGNFQYRLTVSEAGNLGIANCRVASNPVIIIVNAKPTTSAGNNGPKCAGGIIKLNATGGTLYNWTGPNGFTASGASVTASNASVTSWYYVMVTNSAGCSIKDSTKTILYAKSTVKFIISSPACLNNNINFTDQTIPAPGQTITKWNWDFGDAASATLQNPVHSYTSVNSFPVTLVIQTGNGCSDTLTQTVVIHQFPQPDFVLPEVCLSDPFAVFTDASTITDNSQAGFSYLWNFGDPAATPANPNSSTLANPKHNYNSSGIYKVDLTVTSKDGCLSNTIKNFTVNGAVPAATFKIDTAGQLCSNRDVSIINNSTVNFGIITRLEIFWDPADSRIKTTDESPAPGKKYTHTYPVFGTPSTKDYQVKLVAYSGISCVNESTQILTLKASPLAVFNDIPPVCEGIDPFTITAGTNATGAPGTGVYTGNGINASGLFNPQLAKPGDHLLRYTFIASNQCSSYDENSITVFSQPAVNAGPDRTVLEGGFITINPTAPGNNLSFLWSPSSGLDNPTALNPKASPANDQLYLLTVTSSDNCSSSDDVFIKVLKTPVIPNAFSPNGDGINDTWIIRYLDSYPGVDVQLFDRYGQLVYHNVGYSIPWNGTKNGIPLPVGTYYYIIDRKVALNKLIGSVTIIR